MSVMTSFFNDSFVLCLVLVPCSPDVMLDISKSMRSVVPCKDPTTSISEPLGDASIAMQNNAPQFGEPAFKNMILASKDPVAIDKVFQEMCLLRKSDHVEMAGKLGSGEADIEKITIVGNELKAVMQEIKPASGSKLIKMMQEAAKNR